MVQSGADWKKVGLELRLFVARVRLIYCRSVALMRPSAACCWRAVSPITVTWQWESAVAARALVRSKRRGAYRRAPLSYDIDSGLGQFLSPAALRLVAVDYQDGLLSRLNGLVRGAYSKACQCIMVGSSYNQLFNCKSAGTSLETASVLKTLIQTVNDKARVLTFNYASQALNNSFFLSRLVWTSSKCLLCDILADAVFAQSPKGSSPPSSSSFLARSIEDEFGSLIDLKHQFSHAAIGMMGSGWVWLAHDQHLRLGVIGTYGPGTLLAHNRVQRGDWSGVLGTDRPTTDIAPGPAFGQVAVEATRVAQRAQAERIVALNELANAIGSQSKRQPVAGAGVDPPSPRSNVDSASTSKPSRLNPRRRSFSSSAPNDSSWDIFHPRPSSPSPAPPGSGGREAEQINAALELYPLLCLSVHEHAWLTDYGVWGKEAYATKFWDVIDWSAIGATYDRNASMRGDRSFSSTSQTSSQWA